jgi:trk system potassium uptake protein TrkH
LRLQPTQIIALAFLGIILLGACLLCLPAASRNAESCGVMGALFTATSATCVTGLVLFDTWSQWSGFGQGVILGLIEIGGLGFMSAASTFVFLLRRKVGLKQRMVMAQALSLNDMEDVVRLQKWAVLGSLCVQLAGAVILFFCFLPGQGAASAAWWGVFHAVSAFCNAGFDVMGSLTPGASIMPYNGHVLVCLTLMALIVVGGLGFFVWEEIARLRSFRRFSVYTKLVLVMSLALILGGWVLLCALEWNNPHTFGPMPVWQKLLGGLFQSVTVRTAGFAAVDQALLTDAGKGVSMLLMLVGGSSGSTAGGIKTVTVVVLVLFLWARARGRQTVSVFKHSIQADKVLDAMTISAIVVALALFGGVFISATSPVSFTDALYESVSALATVGLTAGATGSLSTLSQILIMIFMYFGRVGVLTISLGFLMGDRAQERFRYAQTNLLIG